MFLYLIQLLFILLTNVVNELNDTKMTSNKLISVDFEVYGRVQGVFFRKYTQQQAKKLNLKGWCMNTERGTVQGVLQGELNNVEAMKKWLKTTGSPSSRIEKAEFSNETDIKSLTFGTFDIKR